MEKEEDKSFEEETDEEFAGHRTLLDSFRRVQGHMIAQNLAIFNQQCLKLHGKVIDLSEYIKRMQEQTQVWGGWNYQHYKKAKQQLVDTITSMDKKHYNTVIYAKHNDCVDEALFQQAQIEPGKGSKVILLNLASRAHVCGRWDSPYLGTQEETIERRSAVYRHALDPGFNPHLLQQEVDINGGVRPGQHVPEFGCITTCGVPILRRVNFHLTTDIKFIDVVACGAIDLRFVQYWRWGEREKYMGSAFFGTLDEKAFVKHTKRKMRMVLLAAAAGGWTVLVLGALGCGAYANPPEVVVRCWQEVLQEEIFQHRFETVVFAILGDVIAPFVTAFGNLPHEGANPSASGEPSSQ